jgi:HB1, ASXL, restriction endonuclease HTH domain
MGFVSLKGKEALMSTVPIDYMAVIRDIERQRAIWNDRFDAAAAAIRQLMALQSESRQPSLIGMDAPIPAAAMPRVGMVDVAMSVLEREARPVPNMELARMVEAAGFVHQSKNFPNTLNSVLHRRSKNVGDVVKVGNSWSVK